MDRSLLLTRIRELIVEQLGAELDTIDEDSRLIDDLGADSLDCIELVMAIEEEFLISVADEHMDRLNTVGLLVDYVAKELEQQHGG